MSRIGSLKITIEFVFFYIYIQFPGYDLEIAVGNYVFYIFLMQLLIGRYQGKV